MRVESSPSRARACILAGGAGRRLGGAKATVPLAGRPLISYPLAAVAQAGLDPVVVAKPDMPLPGLHAEVWLEPAEPRHPLCGIVEALRRASSPILILGCDMPFVTGELLRWLSSLDAGLAVANAAGRPQPMLARYSPELIDELSAGLEAQARVTAVVADLGPRWVTEAELAQFGDPALMTWSVNTPADLSRAERLLAAD